MNKNKWNVESIIQQYETSGKIMYQATLTGDYRINNIEGERLTKIFKLFEQDRQLANECIPELLKSKNVVVRTKAAAYCFALKEHTADAERILFEIINDPQNGIFGFNAKMLLEGWKEKGEVTIYQKKQN